MDIELLKRLPRRAFLTSAAAAGTSLAAGTLPVRTFGQNPPHCPAPPTGGTPFVPGSDTRPITLRKAVSALTAAQLSELENAWTALRALPSTDVRSWILQADIHATYCASCMDTTQIHFKWSFFPWHRAYLYYFERILGSLVGDINNFRLPYWDWENAASRMMPAPYTAPGNATNSLWDGTRALAAAASLPAGDANASVVNVLYGETDFASFGGTAVGGGDCENGPHGQVHVDVGGFTGHMGSFGPAAQDPIFFAHHCNIDKIWSAWNHLPSGGLPPGSYQNPTSSAFLSQRWTFYDELGNKVSISAGDVLDHQNNLRYIYQPTYFIPVIPLWEILICRLIFPPPGPDPVIQITDNQRTAIFSAARLGSPVVFEMKGVQLPGPGLFDLYEIEVTGARNLLGTMAIVPDLPKGMAMSRKGNLAVDITKFIGTMLASQNPSSLAFAAREGGSSFPLKASSVQIRINPQPKAIT